MQEDQENNQLQNDEKFDLIKSALITKFLGEKLKKETELVKLNSLLLNVKYINLRRKEKSQELLENINELKNIAQNFLNFKTKIVTIFQKDFQNDQDINLFIFSNFIIIKDQLFANFIECIEILRQDYFKRVNEIKLQFEKDKAKIENSYSYHFKIINDQIMAMEADFYYKMLEDEAKFTKKKESINCEHLDHIVTMKLDMEKKIEALKKKFHENQKLLENETFFSSKPDEITSKNEKLETEIQRDKQKILSLMDKCQSVKEEINLMDIDFLLLNKKKKIHEKYNQYAVLNRTFEQKKKKIKESILDVIRSSTSAMEKIRSQTKKCQKILSFFNMCHKMESKEEQKTLFCKSNVISEKIDWNFLLGNENLVECCFIKDLFEQEFNDYSCSFYLKFAKVNIEIKSLKLIKSDLEKENFYLKKKLKNYISSIEINCC